MTNNKKEIKNDMEENKKHMNKIQEQNNEKMNQMMQIMLDLKKEIETPRIYNVDQVHPSFREQFVQFYSNAQIEKQSRKSTEISV